jgi:hypothetical protein
LLFPRDSQYLLAFGGKTSARSFAAGLMINAFWVQAGEQYYLIGACFFLG